MKSVEKNQVRGCSPETPTVCPSPYDDDVHLDDGDGEELVLPAPIGDRAPPVERVLNEVRGMAIVTTAISCLTGWTRTQTQGWRETRNNQISIKAQQHKYA